MSESFQIALKKLISQDSAEEAIESLLSYYEPLISGRNPKKTVVNNYNTLIRLSSRLKRLEKSLSEGVIDHEDASRSRSKIILSLTNYIDSLPPALVNVLQKSYQQSLRGESEGIEEEESISNEIQQDFEEIVLEEDSIETF